MVLIIYILALKRSGSLTISGCLICTQTVEHWHDFQTQCPYKINMYLENCIKIINSTKQVSKAVAEEYKSTTGVKGKTPLLDLENL